MSHYLNLLTAALLIILPLQSRAFTVVDEGGEPVIAASVADANGVLIGITDRSGTFNPTPDTYFPLTVRSIGMADSHVAAEADTITMTWLPVALNAVTVTPGDRPVMRVLCYIKETSGMIVGRDTTRLVAEYMADALVPVAKAKKFKAKDEHRLRHLAKRYNLATTMTEPFDTATMIDNMSLAVFAALPSKPLEETAKLKPLTTGTDTVLTSDGVLRMQMTKSPNGYYQYYDALAIFKNHHLNPGILKLFGLTVDITEMARSDRYLPSADGLHPTADLVERTMAMQGMFKGKLIKSAMKVKDDIDFNTYIELYPVDVTYLTEAEALDLKKSAPASEFILPKQQ